MQLILSVINIAELWYNILTEAINIKLNTPNYELLIISQFFYIKVSGVKYLCSRYYTIIYYKKMNFIWSK